MSPRMPRFFTGGLWLVLPVLAAAGLLCLWQQPSVAFALLGGAVLCG